MLATAICSTTTTCAVAIQHQDTTGADTPLVDGVKARWNRAIRKLYDMLSLEDDWDGMDSDAPPEELVRSAIEFAGCLRDSGALPPPSRVSANPAGSVSFEWQPPGAYTSVEVVAPYHFEWMQVTEGQKPRFRTEVWRQRQAI